MKIAVITGGNFMPQTIDDPNEQHDSFIVLEDKNQSFRVSFGMNRDDEMSKPYEPYYARVLSLEKCIQIRDALSKAIATWKDNENFRNILVDKEGREVRVIKR